MFDSIYIQASSAEEADKKRDEVYSGFWKSFQERYQKGEVSSEALNNQMVEAAYRGIVPLRIHFMQKDFKEVFVRILSFVDSHAQMKLAEIQQEFSAQTFQKAVTPVKVASHQNPERSSQAYELSMVNAIV